MSPLVGPLMEDLPALRGEFIAVGDMECEGGVGCNRGGWLVCDGRAAFELDPEPERLA